MNCPQCKAPVAESVTVCPYCGTQIRRIHRMFSFGKISVILSMVNLISIVCILVLLRIFQTAIFDFSLFFTNILMLLAVLSIVFGSVAVAKDKTNILGIIGLIIGFCFLIGLAFGISLAMSLKF